jgi:hypothetical protein
MRACPRGSGRREWPMSDVANGIEMAFLYAAAAARTAFTGGAFSLDALLG